MQTPDVRGDRLLMCITIPHSSGERQRAVARFLRRQGGSSVHLTVFVDVADRRVAAGLGLPTAFQAAIALEPMASQRRRWSPALGLRAATTRKVVIGRGAVEENGSVQRNAPRLSGPESSKREVCKSGFSESCEHRSPPFPLCAAGR